MGAKFSTLADLFEFPTFWPLGKTCQKWRRMARIYLPEIRSPYFHLSYRKFNKSACQTLILEQIQKARQSNNMEAIKPLTNRITNVKHKFLKNNNHLNYD